ncbi:hypothetical protein [Stenotrophomonas maltophilia]|uniref:hypothetical protein n=1 Tax=Stenotrophomonas maltophilia TaxID=40324 RepID=UPI0015E05A10|nr:hypothetical protein [Stenotrophomonas maltophilia]HEL4163167.1 hypothetical protein [Stenotrophomonas maltophilia]
MDAIYIWWLAMGVGCVASAFFYIWLRKWSREILEDSVQPVNVCTQSAISEKPFDADTLLDLACSRLDESASCLGVINLNPDIVKYLSAHQAIARSVFYPHLQELYENLEGGALINPDEAATLLQMHNQSRYFGDGSGDIPQWVSDNRWPAFEEQRDHLIDVVRRRQQRNLMSAVTDVQTEITSPVKRKM